MGFSELARVGTGEIASQLELFGGLAEFYEKRRARACEARVQAAGPHRGVRLLKAVPPYIKWPIWRARPARINTGPKSFLQLYNKKTFGSHEQTARTLIFKRSFNLTTVPRVMAEVSYLAGELGAHDRKVLCALSEHAMGNNRNEQGYFLRTAQLADILGLSRRNKKNYEDLARSLWRLSRTIVHLNQHDELSQSWGTKGFLLLPELAAHKIGREWELIYDFPEAANDLIRRGALGTVDVRRLNALKSPTAESLYCLLYDVAQWSKLPSITYGVADLIQRLGVSIPSRSNGRRIYQDWSKPIRIIHAAAEKTYSVGQIIVDYRVDNCGAGTNATFFFARGQCRKGHLPR